MEADARVTRGEETRVQLTETELVRPLGESLSYAGAERNYLLLLSNTPRNNKNTKQKQKHKVKTQTQTQTQTQSQTQNSSSYIPSAL